MIAELVCEYWSHDEEYTDEFENEEGHAQADAICQRCGNRRLAWTGPEWDAPGMPGGPAVEEGGVSR